MHHRTMSDKRKISIAILGTEDDLKENLAYAISETNERNTYEVTFTANLYEESEEIRKLFSSKLHPDMCLLVVEDGFKTQEVQKQIEKLHEITGKPKEEFIVVLPLGSKPEESYPFKFYTMEELFNKLRKMAQDTKPISSNKRSADQMHIQMDTDKRQSFFAKVRRVDAGSSADNQNSLKGNHSDTKLNLVLLGMSGTGKSATGNTILGKTEFLSKASSMSVTRQCQAAETEINGTCVRVIDTPDIFDDDITSSVKNHHVTQCRQLCQSDPCVYLLVIHVSRFTDGERDILKKFEKCFGPKVKDQTIILFTRGEDLQSAEMSLDDFLQDCQPELKNIVKQCGGRCVLFENKATRQSQVSQLMQTVNMMLNN